ncbi:hypothetical protein C8Q76DRAFT_310311 [Earliella scabrosa]|nr:hypothetical protein C8Q76DRAFT_310311 [Earliella scabrosa]
MDPTHGVVAIAMLSGTLASTAQTRATAATVVAEARVATGAGLVVTDRTLVDVAAVGVAATSVVSLACRARPRQYVILVHDGGETKNGIITTTDEFDTVRRSCSC